MDKEYTCFFSGHRVLPAAKKEIIKEQLIRSIVSLIEDKGVTDFIAGGALGFDTLAAQTVIDLKEEYPYIKLNMYYPCYKQFQKWSERDKNKWYNIDILCDSRIFISEEYTDDCMQRRNQKMVDDSYYGICFCMKNNTGTGATIKYARQCGKSVENIADIIYGEY